MKLKNPLIILFFGIVAFTSFAFINAVNKEEAKVESEQGLYLFVKASPSNTYEYLGTIEPSIVPSHKAGKLIPFMVKKGKEKYPSANAIIFKNANLDKADLVKIKD
ncbi:MAG: hypothetical protein EP332_06405 [Bacteroidetes bacterium]|nr:MAG: hypothetical protein EP332_06405 [Bacteroidota bacterium]